SFDLALLFRARRLGFAIEQVPVQFRYLDEPSSVRFLRDTARMLRDLLLIRTRLVGDRFERWSQVFVQRYMRGAGNSADLIRSPRAGPALAVALGSSLILMVIGRLGFARALLVPAGWLAAIVCVLLFAWRLDADRPRHPPRLFRTENERGWFFAVLALTAVLRFVRLGEFPPMEHGDSAECGLQAL